MRANLLVAFRVPKRDSSMAQCEDSYAVSPGGRRIAVSDGATEAVFSRIWAQCVAECWVSAAANIADPAWMTDARRRFYSTIQTAGAPWYLLQKLEAGSYATLLGLEIDPDLQRFSAVSIGDSCLFWESDNGVRRFPERPTSRRPFLIGTIDAIGFGSSIQVLRDEGFPVGRNRLFLMTDAVAAWADASFDKGIDPLRVFASLRTEEDFANWLSEVRSDSAIRNDDSTLLILEVDVAPSVQEGHSVLLENKDKADNALSFGFSGGRTESTPLFHGPGTPIRESGDHSSGFAEGIFRRFRDYLSYFRRLAQLCRSLFP